MAAISLPAHTATAGSLAIRLAASSLQSQELAQIHWEGDSRDVLAGFPEEIRDLSKIADVIYVLHCFEKDSRKTDRRDLRVAKDRLWRVRQHIEGQKKHAKRLGK